MEQFKDAAKVLAATAMANSIRYMSNREYLNELPTTSCQNHYTLGDGPNDSILNQSHIRWIKVEQIGKHADDSHKCFSAMQKILFSCHDSQRKQIIFLVNGDGNKVDLYIGIRFIGEINQSACNIFAQSTASYIRTLWSGTRTSFVKGNEAPAKSLKIKNEYQYMYSLTGVPSFVEKPGEEALTSLDTLIGALGDKRFTYMVIANPISEVDVNSLIHECNEMQGQLESVKSFDFSESISTTETETISKTISEFKNWNETDSISKKDTKGTLLMGLAPVALGLAASLCFPPAASLIPVIASAGGKDGDKYRGLGMMAGFGMNILSGLVPQNTHGSSHGGGSSQGSTTSNGFSKGQSETLSTKIVNKHADYASKQITSHIQRLEKGLGQGMWETGIYLLADDESIAHSAAMQLKSIISGSNSHLEPVRLHDLSIRLDDEDEYSRTISALQHYSMPTIPIQYRSKGSDHTIDNPFEPSRSHLTTYLTTEELTCVINLPQKSVPGVSVVDHYPDFPLPYSVADLKNTISLGNLMYSGSESNIQVNLPIDTLSRHSLVAGVNGSGKTNTVINVLDGLMTAGRPFMVIEPAKTEYVDWAIEYNKSISDPEKRIKIFMPGCEKYSKSDRELDKLKLNPFEVINLGDNELRVMSHIDRLKAIFASAFPMQDILPVVMEHLLYDLYTDVAPMIDKTDPLYMKKGFPMLSSINQEFIKNLMRNLGYAQENTQNISAALRTRFKSLKCGWKGEMLNNEQLTDMEWSDLFGTPCIINLSFAGDDQDRAFIMSLLLQFLYEYRIAETEIKGYSFNSNVCRHLVVVEEAHRIMGQCDNSESPQYKSGMMFSNFLSEVRAYGQGMMIVDQVPTRLIPDAIKNTNIKIIHKLVASDDSKLIAECIGLTDEQKKVISKLTVGQAVISGLNSANVNMQGHTDLYLAKIHEKKGN